MDFKRFLVGLIYLDRAIKRSLQIANTIRKLADLLLSSLGFTVSHFASETNSFLKSIGFEVITQQSPCVVIESSQF